MPTNEMADLNSIDTHRVAIESGDSTEAKRIEDEAEQQGRSDAAFAMRIARGTNDHLDRLQESLYND